MIDRCTCRGRGERIGGKISDICGGNDKVSASEFYGRKKVVESI